MVWGENCLTWHDEIDGENMRKWQPGPVPDNHHIMTTWHEHEELDEVFEFAQCCAQHPIAEVVSTLIIHIADNDDRAAMLARFDKAGASQE
ncbi:MAG: hypothetical protein RLN87_03805 [Parasphingopyxis sp.]|uniref:DUF7684 family protein n=1 Tax=Parasphingopyxis sp. TaxID=1920299 RepID=UPI002617E54C|nr:hypothetical protein [uncultured Parasphingopyxis sp.]